MNNLKLSFELVMPLVLYMLSGALLKKTGVLDRATGDKLTGVVTSLLLPLMLFKSIYNCDLSAAFAGPVVLYCFAAIIVALIICIFLFRALEKSPAKRGSYIMGSCRGNTGLVGLAVAAQIFGQDNIVIPALISSVLMLSCNIASVIVYEICAEKERALAAGGEGRKANIDPKLMLRDLAKNRLITGILVGLVFNLLKIPVPDWIMSAVNGLSNSASPLSLIVLGATFSLKAALPEKRNLIIAILFKLMIMPAIFVALPLAWNWEGTAIVALMVQSASPTAVSSYPMAKASGCNGQVAGDIVTLTTSFSMLTLFFWIFTFKSIGIF